MKIGHSRVIWGFFLIFFSTTTMAVDGQLDSLRNELQSSPENSKAMVNTHNELAWYFRDIRPDSALYHASAALSIAREQSYTDLEIQSINYIGVAYRNLSNFTKAFEKYLEALKLSEERGNAEQRGYSLINLGNLYLYQTNFQGAIRYFIQALDQAQTLADKRMVAYCYTNLGRSYKGISEYGQAELYYNQAIEIRKELEDRYGQHTAEIELAEIYMLRGDHQLSEKVNLDLLSRVDKRESPRLITIIYNNLSKIYLSREKLIKAKQYANMALELTDDVNNRYDEKNVLENLANIYATGDQYRQAYETHVEYSQLNQQLFSEENIRKIEQLKGQYEMEKQEVENAFLKEQAKLNQQIINRQNTIITLAIVGVILLLIVAFVYIRGFIVKKRLSNEIKTQRDKILADKETIEKQSKKLQELDKAKSRFFANISHDLRSPLSLIMGNLEMLKDDEGVVMTANSQKNLDIGLKNCKRLLYLTDEINDLIKLEEGKINLRKEVIRVDSYVGMLSEMFEGTADYKGVRLEFKSSLQPSDCLFVDPRQFEKIFYNLVSNAIKHTSKGDKITIALEKQSGSIILKISDTGVGISRDSLPYIFDRFYQSKDNEYRSREGLGIGLALVRELVELHNGNISVDSAPGLGTTFVVAFSIEEEATISQPVPATTYTYISDRRHLYDEIDRESAGANLPKLEEEKSTVLIVDDHPEIRYHIRQILEDDYHIIEAAHGIEALEFLKRNEIDLVISDLMMPWMDGFELIEAIKKNDAYSKIPILVVSARITDTDHEKVLAKGINDYIQKPFKKKELLLRINNLLSQKDLQQVHPFDDLLDAQNQSSLESSIMSKLEQVVMEKIGDPNLSVYDLADALAASERQVYRLVKKITGMTPFEYVAEIKMKYVDYLIRKGKVKNATEAARSIGLKNVTVFSKNYEKMFGKKPGEVLSAD